MFIGGAVVQWLRDGLGIIEEAAETAAATPVPAATPAELLGLFDGWRPATVGKWIDRTEPAPRA